MELGVDEASYGSALIYQVPFCNPFWTTINNLTGKDTTLWQQLPKECQSSTTIFALVASFLVVLCTLVHLATIVSYSNMKDEIFDKSKSSKKENAGGRRKGKAAKKSEPGIVKEAVDYAFAMKTQHRLRMTFAFCGFLSSAILLPIAIGSASAVYMQPILASFEEQTQFNTSLNHYRVAISTFFHLTLTASLCALFLMVVERLQEQFRLNPEDYFKFSPGDTAKRKHYSEASDYDRSSTFAGSVRYDYEDWRKDSPSTPVKSDKLTPMEASLMYTFRDSYAIVDLIAVLLVPAAAATVTTLAVAVFEAHFEPYGQVLLTHAVGREAGISGLLSFNPDSYPNAVYVYGATIGLLVVAIIIANIVSMFRCQTLQEIAKHLAGYKRSVEIYHREKRKQAKRPMQGFRRRLGTGGTDSVRIGKKLRRFSRRANRQDPDGLSLSNSKERIDSAYMEETSLSFMPPPPPPQGVRFSMLSVDNLSLPPPPRPESLMNIPERGSLASFPSLPSLLPDDDITQIEEPPDDEMASEKTRAFFGTIREARVALVAFLTYIFAAAPLLGIFVAGVFYQGEVPVPRNITKIPVPPDDNGIKSIMDIVVEGSGFLEPTPYDAGVTLSDDNTYNNHLEDMRQSANYQNWITTLSSAFFILYVFASVTPFFAYCIVSPRFRAEVRRFFGCCFCFQWQTYRKKAAKQGGLHDRSRSNRSIAMSSSNQNFHRSSHSFSEVQRARIHSSNSSRDKYSLSSSRRTGRPLRREQTIAGVRNMAWESTHI